MKLIEPPFFPGADPDLANSPGAPGAETLALEAKLFRWTWGDCDVLYSYGPKYQL